MTKKSVNSAKKRRNPIPARRGVMLGAAIGFVVVIGLVIPLSAMQLENHNSFCASCHTEGEKTFYDRSTAGAPADLASMHDSHGQARCIDCHTGPGIIGRYGGLIAGSTDLISFFSGHYPQPAALEEPYPDANCIKCHQKVAASRDFNNHFHVFMFQWQSLDPNNAAHCVDCHASHDTTNDAGLAFINQEKTIRVCQNCHAASRGG